jgi:hypothetical protein
MIASKAPVTSTPNRLPPFLATTGWRLAFTSSFMSWI